MAFLFFPFPTSFAHSTLSLPRKPAFRVDNKAMDLCELSSILMAANHHTRLLLHSKFLMRRLNTLSCFREMTLCPAASVRLLYHGQDLGPFACSCTPVVE
ncbi:hypothetical protein MAP00_007038 [Monascus purpureus]|nr:hypothetical protein MAP00_007038 [Monascus purpureus]